MSEVFSGTVDVQNSSGTTTIRLDGNSSDITVWRKVSGINREVMKFDASHGALYIGSEGNEGDLIVRDGQGRQVLHFDSNYAALYIGTVGNEGDVILRNTAGDDTVKIDGHEGDFVVWRKIGGTTREVLKFDASHAALYIGCEGNEGDLIVRDAGGRDVFHFDSNYAALYVGAAGNEGDVIVRDGNGNERIRLDGHTGDIRLQGADCAERFDVADAIAIEPGSVLVIDDGGALSPCAQAYDKRVAGVVSGANGLSSGIILNTSAKPQASQPVALNGKVYCKVDARLSPIQPGDLLTTSATPGHAMKASDRDRSFGTVIGKALQGLEDGQGMISILVSLQ